MWYCEASKVIPFTQKEAWSVITDLERWHEWDPHVVEAALLAELQVGVQGRVKMIDGTIIDFTVAELHQEEKIILQVPYSLGIHLNLIWEIRPQSEVTFSYRIEAIGKLSWFWKFFMKKKLEERTLQALENLSSEENKQKLLKQEGFSSVYKAPPASSHEEPSLKGEEKSKDALVPVKTMEDKEESVLKEEAVESKANATNKILNKEESVEEKEIKPRAKRKPKVDLSKKDTSKAKSSLTKKATTKKEATQKTTVKKSSTKRSPGKDSKKKKEE